MNARDGSGASATLCGLSRRGQGTVNVNSWAPDSRHFAYVRLSHRLEVAPDDGPLGHRRAVPSAVEVGLESRAE